jgi:hypothetical protein
MNIERAIKAPFADAKWLTKTAWAGLWAALGVTFPAVTGYTLDYMRNVANGYETPMPEWNTEFGRWWSRGFFVLLAGFIYCLPAFVLMGVGFIPLVGAAVMGSVSDSADALAIVGGGSVCLTMMIASIYLLAISVFFSAAQVNYALSNDFGALFRFKEILARLRTDGAGYFAAWGMSIVVSVASSTIAGFIGSILGATMVLTVLAPFLGGAVGFLAGMMAAHLFGQYAAKAYGLPGLQPAFSAPAGYTASTPPAPPAPPVVDVPEPPQPPAPIDVAESAPAPESPEPPSMDGTVDPE